jgi:hypothetical protein
MNQRFTEDFDALIQKETELKKITSVGDMA